MVYLEVAVVTMIGLVSEKSRKSVPVVAAELGLNYLPICTIHVRICRARNGSMSIKLLHI